VEVAGNLPFPGSPSLTLGVSYAAVWIMSVVSAVAGGAAAGGQGLSGRDVVTGAGSGGEPRIAGERFLPFYDEPDDMVPVPVTGGCAPVGLPVAVTSTEGSAVSGPCAVREATPTVGVGGRATPGAPVRLVVPRPVEGPAMAGQDREAVERAAHLARVCATFPTKISQRSVDRLARLLSTDG